MFSNKRINVYAEDRKTILGTVSATATSIGAAKVANSPAAYQARIHGQYAWVSTHKHVFTTGKNIHKSHCDEKTGVMQRCNEPNPNWRSNN